MRYPRWQGYKHGVGIQLNFTNGTFEARNPEKILHFQGFWFVIKKHKDVR